MTSKAKTTPSTELEDLQAENAALTEALTEANAQAKVFTDGQEQLTDLHRLVCSGSVGPEDRLRSENWLAAL